VDVTAAARANARTVRLLDGLVGFWVVLWLGIGVWVTIDVHHLSQLATTLGQSAKSLRQISDVVAGLSQLPLVGGSLGTLAKSAAETAASASRSAAAAERSVRQLSYLLGVIVVVIPTVPTLAAYLPYRIRRYREVRAVRAALARPAADAVLRHYLAERALANLPLRQLMAISDDPWRDAAGGRLDVLAGAELARLGLDPRRLDPSGEAERQAATGVADPT